ncbi:hypothetical protein E3P92_01752 [Wallemia ichthyophaga]|uniref:NASP-related protein sim3 n=1 Tax=Wallemia ichthyophaga (strain EXF-994 / CBS 113033) TaxID=1299270 RepID=R9AM41_WALI9|nr:NASP-related protein sim3 [Wallemia ichthyophaga EXF-994]TIA99579.1 hypothetical protein E3P95_02011 [Wallemia ichthyophaga]EOR01171.1 NASP-related protein sim3 [Wallemia ichthyophaga EXF-994]TIB00547.1 hypothetical protein E3P94_02135 [Wallemia ichthyophaga]TIB15170.1 hypothetical protein E3P92_01752 [Wallemia ichthyophaga]TIB35846.1 hypothetical protein E3P84_01186 [Wallemia ichthyophaga]
MSESSSELSNITQEAHRLVSIGNYNEASNKYSDALEIVRDTHGELSVESAALLLKYAESLYLHAVSQSDVIGKSDEAGDTADTADAANAAHTAHTPSTSNASTANTANTDNLIQLSDDDDDDDNDDQGDDDNQPEQDPDHSNEDTPDDDFGAAWEVADLAKVIYQKLDGDNNKLCLADAHMLLGDIALELETFEAAALEYSSSLEIKKLILNPTSRVLAEAHFKLAISYELVPGHVRRDTALVHVQDAKEVLDGRLGELKKRVESGAPVEVSGENENNDKPALRERVERLSIEDATKEIKDIEELIGDLREKIAELEQPPPPASEDPSKSTVDVLVAEMDKAKQSVASDAPVNVLQPKKKQDKRKAEDQPASEADKKVKSDPHAHPGKKTETENEETPN